MRLTNDDVARIVFNAFQKALSEKDNGLLKDNNPLRSSYFVSQIGDELKKHFQGAKTHYQAIESIFNEKKKGGEWLYDICVTLQLNIRDTRHKDGIADINTNILFACESEFDTKISAFATDFGKLLCSNANQYLYIQGLDQSTFNGRASFISERKNLIKNNLWHQIKDDFVLAFIPTPGKKREKSFWDTHENEVLGWASIWIYDVSKNDFVEYKK